MSGVVSEVGLVVNLPVLADRHPSVTDAEHVTRQELLDALEQGLPPKAELKAEVILEPFEVGLNARQERDQGLDLAGEIENPVDLGVIKRLDAEAVASAEQRFGPLVP